ncbi:MAG: HIT family protein [Desulfobacca sp.]|uniref:HIT family protein n=1 Tax=Desulfobacca sp. TaxID=2067990 RepID=UPI00404B9833
MTTCIFCQIAAGQARAERLLETARVLAFLDIAPVHYGHTLVIPKEHFENFFDLPDDLWLEMGRVSRKVALALRRKLYAQGINLGMNNLSAAGQVVFHAHLHVIPRYHDDGLHLFPQGSYQGQDLASVGRQLREALADL